MKIVNKLWVDGKYRKVVRLGDKWICPFCYDFSCKENQKSINNHLKECSFYLKERKEKEGVN